jgi:DNA-binding LytR/AlgR family response regulator
MLKSTSGWVFITVGDILHLTAEDKYARLTSTDGTSIVLLHSLADLEERLACGHRIGEWIFLRTHRSCIVAMHYADGLEGRKQVKLGAHWVPVSRSAWTRILDVLGSVHSGKTTVRSA